MVQQPQASVILPVHNGMPYLPATIDSLFAQEFGDFEVIAIDDGSTDDTTRYLRSIQDPRLSYHRLEKVGQAQAMNHGLAIARAEMIFRIDADDIALPGRFAAQYARMIGQPDLVLLGCQTEIIDRDGVVLDEFHYPISDEAIRWAFLFGNPFLHPGVIYRRKMALDLGGYESRFEPAEDYRFWAKFLRVGKVANMPRVLMQYRQHQNNVTVRKQAVSVANSSEVVKEYASELIGDSRGDLAKMLHLYHRHGRQVDGRILEQVASVYRELVTVFDGTGHEDEDSRELRSMINDVTVCLRWRCLVNARRSLGHPLRCLFYMQMAREFDPEGGGISAIVRRRFYALQGLFDRKPAAVEDFTPFFAGTRNRYDSD